MKKTADDAVKDLLAWMDGDEHALDGWNEPAEGEHGPVVMYRQDAYHDVLIYADGFEERFYIGD